MENFAGPDNFAVVSYNLKLGLASVNILVNLWNILYDELGAFSKLLIL